MQMANSLFSLCTQHEMHIHYLQSLCRLQSGELWTMCCRVSPSWYLSRHDIHNAPKLHRNITIVAWKLRYWWNSIERVRSVRRWKISNTLSVAIEVQMCYQCCCRCCYCVLLPLLSCSTSFYWFMSSRYHSHPFNIIYSNSNSFVQRKKLIDSPRFIQNCNSALLCSSTMSHTQFEWYCPFSLML